MNNEELDARRNDLRLQAATHQKRLQELREEMQRIQAVLNAVDGALLDCDYWAAKLAETEDEIDET